MVGGPMKTAVNEWLMTPGALEVTSGLVAASLAGIGLKEIVGIVRLDGLSKEQRRELDMLDDAKPEWFLPRAIRSIHAGLVAKAMRGGPDPRIGWRHDAFDVRHLGHTWTSDPGFDPTAECFDFTDIATPIMDETGHLV